MAYDPAKRHHWQMNALVWPASAGQAGQKSEVIAVCELCGTVRTYDLASGTNQMIIGGTCPGTSPEPSKP